MKTFNYLIIVFLFLFFSCSKENKPTNETKPKLHETSTLESTKRYQIKSGIVTYKVENNLMQEKLTTILYFDDYGAKESKETITEFKMMGQSIKNHKLSLLNNGYHYELDLEKKTGEKFKFLKHNDREMDISKFSKEKMKEFNIKKEGTEVVLGKVCDKNSMENKNMNMKGTVSVWQGITLKSDIQMGNFKIKTTAVKFEENSAVPSSKFEVPSDFNIKDVNSKTK